MKARALSMTCRDALASKLRQSMAMTTTRDSVGLTGGPAVAAARSTADMSAAPRLSISSADNTRRRRPLIVTVNLSGPSPVTGAPVRSMTCTSTGMTSRPDRNVDVGFWVASVCWPAPQRVATPSINTPIAGVSRILMGCRVGGTITWPRHACSCPPAGDGPPLGARPAPRRPGLHAYRRNRRHPRQPRGLHGDPRRPPASPTRAATGPAGAPSSSRPATTSIVVRARAR